VLYDLRRFEAWVSGLELGVWRLWRRLFLKRIWKTGEDGKMLDFNSYLLKNYLTKNDVSSGGFTI